jgi:hypothetical protein
MLNDSKLIVSVLSLTSRRVSYVVNGKCKYSDLIITIVTICGAGEEWRRSVGPIV